MEVTTSLPESLRDLSARFGSDAPAVLEQIERTHDCSCPVRLVGERITIDRETGEILDRYGSAGEPSGFVLLPCGNRRASRCPACSEMYRGDAFALIRAGLAGDDAKGVSTELASHPRVFVTFTAPSFGPVHRRVMRGGQGLSCRQRPNESVCRHGRAASCAIRHDEDDPALGQALCPDCFDYVGAVLWNAHVPALWHRLVTAITRALASEAGVSRTALRRLLRLRFAKVAEFQRRGLVHLHAIFRLDGPGPGVTAPPAWASTELLADVIAATAARTSLQTDGPDGGRISICWGVQMEVRAIRTGGEGEGSEASVSGYVAKYATKAAESAGGLDRRIRSAYEIERLAVTDHARRLMGACWLLGGMPAFEELRLREWAHMLGFRGHFLTKARRYSVTFGELRAARMRYRAELAAIARGDTLIPDDGSTVVVGGFEFAGVGLVGPHRTAVIPAPAP
jgi:uncharacterized Zn-finger protein